MRMETNENAYKTNGSEQTEPLCQVVPQAEKGRQKGKNLQGLLPLWRGQYTGVGKREGASLGSNASKSKARALFTGDIRGPTPPSSLPPS